MTRALLLAAALSRAAAVAPAAQATDAEQVRAAIEQYYDAQSRKDAARAADAWSRSANPRMSREAFETVFGAGDAQYVPTIETLTIASGQARVRVSVAIARTITRNDVPAIVRDTQVNFQLWTKEPGGWKLLSDGPAAEEFADVLLAAAPSDRPRLLAENPAELTSGLRYVLAQRASRLVPARRYAEAREIFELSLAIARATHDRRSESETLQNIGNAYYFLREYDLAADFYRQRLAFARSMDDEEGTAASILGLATVAYSRGEYGAALAQYREALAIYEKREDGNAIGRALVSVGNVQYLEAEYDAAAASYHRALALLVAGFDRPGASYARAGLARVFTAQGDLGAALDMYAQVLADARARVSVDPRLKSEVAVTLESIGDLYYRLGNADQARASFDEARRLSESDPAAVARIAASLGLTELVIGRFDAALADYTESRARAEDAKQPDAVARAWVGIGFSHTARAKYADAMAAYRTAIRMFDEQKRQEDAARAWLGLSIAQSGATDYAAALESAGRVRATADAIANDDLAWRGAVRAGEALRKLQRVDEAREAFTRAIATIDRLAADAPTNPDARLLLDDSASAWAGLALTQAAAGDPRAALAALEARRAHVRRVQLAGFHRDVARGMTAGEQAEEQGIVRDLISARAQLRAERALAHPDAVRLGRLREALQAAATRRAEQQARLYTRLPDLQQWRGLQAPPVPDLQEAVGDAHALAVLYLVADDDLLIVTAAPGESGPDIAAIVVPINRRELAARVADAMQPAVLRDAEGWRAHAAPLTASVLAPIAPRLEGRERCVFVPDDVLWRVPFEALPSADRPLAARVDVSYATSLTTLGLQRRAAAARRAHDGVAAAFFAAPAIPDAVRAQLTLAQSGWKAPDDEAAVTASRGFARPYGDAGVVHSGADATEEAIRTAAATVDVLHVAAPLHVNAATPLLSMAVLGSTGETMESNGRWEVREWFAGASQARVIVFGDAASFGSAGTAAAMDTLAWGGAAMGVPALMFGRFPSDAFSTDAVLAAFHAALAGGRTPDEAWHRAAADARASGGDAPSAWSGLRLVGAGR
jgi:tetratricopeptide (TPR) repeat protein